MKSKCVNDVENDYNLIRFGEYTIFEAKVNIIEGLNMRNSMALVDKCQSYEKNVYIRNKEHFLSPRDYLPDYIKQNFPKDIDTSYIDAKSIMQISMLGACTGTNLEIMIEGVDKKAEDFAKSIFSDLNSNNPYSLINY